MAPESWQGPECSQSVVEAGLARGSATPAICARAGSSPRPPTGAVVLGKTHRTEHVVILRARISYSKRRQSKVITGKRSAGQGLGDTKRELPRAPSSGAPRHMLSAPPHQLGVTIHVNVVNQGRSLETQFPGRFTGALRVDTPSNLACIQLPDSQKESGCSA